MKNDRPKKSIRVVLCNAGVPEAGALGGTWETWGHGKTGFWVRGLARVLKWKDKGKTWKPAEG